MDDCTTVPVEVDLPVSVLYWIQRTLPELNWETTTVSIAVSLLALFSSIRASVRTSRARRALRSSADAHQHDAFVACADAFQLRAQRTVFYLAAFLFAHAAFLCLVDLVVGLALFSLAFQSCSSHILFGSVTSFLRDVLIVSGRLVLTFVAFPLAQFGVLNFVLRCVRARFPSTADPAGSLALARLVTAHLAFIWALAAFFYAAWRPLMSRQELGVLLGEPVFASAIWWLAAARVVIFSLKGRDATTSASAPSEADDEGLKKQPLLAVEADKAAR